MNEEHTKNERPTPEGEPQAAHAECCEDSHVSEEGHVHSHAVEVEADESPKHRAKRLRKLKDEDLIVLEEAALNAAGMIDLARRTQAEFDNYQKRVENLRQQEAKYASSSLIRGLFEPIDNLERALQEASKSDDFEALRKGVELTYNQLLAALARNGVGVVSAQHVPFDPEFHEAVVTGVDEAHENNIVLDTFEKGWKLHDRVLRPAKVRVNKKD